MDEPRPFLKTRFITLALKSVVKYDKLVIVWFEANILIDYLIINQF